MQKVVQQCMLDSVKLVLVRVCSIYKITGTECILNTFLIQYISI